MHAPRPRGGTLADLSTPFRDRASGTKSEGVRSFGSGNRPSACLTPIFQTLIVPALQRGTPPRPLQRPVPTKRPRGASAIICAHLRDPLRIEP